MGSRVAKNPVTIPAGIDVDINDGIITVKSSNDILKQNIHSAVDVVKHDNVVTVVPRAGEENADAHAGTMRALLNNMVIGLSQGHERKLVLVGVGYRVQVQGNKLVLSLGFSHPVNYQLPAGVTVETPSQTEIVLKSADKQRVGQVAADIRAFRPPEPYKGKGVRYSDEQIVRKEGKKK